MDSDNLDLLKVFYADNFTDVNIAISRLAEMVSELHERLAAIEERLNEAERGR